MCLKELIAEGHDSNVEIAAVLGVGLGTVNRALNFPSGKFSDKKDKKNKANSGENFPNGNSTPIDTITALAAD
jgi:hypothetical protein